MNKVLILAMSAYVLGGTAGGIQQTNSFDTGKNFNCTVEKCTQVGVHKHSICQAENCTNKGEHIHSGRVYLGHSESDGHGHQGKTSNQEAAAVNLDTQNQNTCSIDGCTISGNHEHKLCGTANCTQTGEHSHNQSNMRRHYQQTGNQTKQHSYSGHH